MTQIIDKRGKGNGFWAEQAFPLDPAAKIRFDHESAAHDKVLNAVRSALPVSIVKIADLESTKRSPQQQAELSAWAANRERADRLDATGRGSDPAIGFA